MEENYLELNYFELNNIMDLKISLDSKIILLWQKKGWGFYPDISKRKNLEKTIEKGRAKSFLELGIPYLILPLVDNDKNYKQVHAAMKNMRQVPSCTELYFERNSTYFNYDKIHPLKSMIFNGNMTLVLDKRFHGRRVLKKAHLNTKFSNINVDSRLIKFVSIHCINNYEEKDIMDDFSDLVSFTEFP